MANFIDTGNMHCMFSVSTKYTFALGHACVINPVENSGI